MEIKNGQLKNLQDATNFACLIAISDDYFVHGKSMCPPTMKSHLQLYYFFQGFMFQTLKQIAQWEIAYNILLKLPNINFGPV